MTSDEAKKMTLALTERNPGHGLMMLATNGPDGTPKIKAMVRMRNDSLERFYFCSNTSTKRVEGFGRQILLA